MKIAIEFPPNDARISDILELLIPVEQMNNFLEQLENPNNSVVRDVVTIEERDDLMRELIALCSRVPNHENSCQALVLRRPEICDCSLGRLHRFLLALAKVREVSGE